MRGEYVRGESGREAEGASEGKGAAEKMETCLLYIERD